MTAIAEHDQAVAAGRTVTMAGALNQALRDALTEDASVLVFGEDVGTLGGVFRVTDGLATAFGEASIGDDVWAQLTAPSNGKSSKMIIVSRTMTSLARREQAGMGAK